MHQVSGGLLHFPILFTDFPTLYPPSTGNTVPSLLTHALQQRHLDMILPDFVPTKLVSFITHTGMLRGAGLCYWSAKQQ